MLIATIMLAYLFLMTVLALVFIMADDSCSFDEYFAVFLFIICLPLWLGIRVFIDIKRKRDRKRKLKAREKLDTVTEE